MSEWHLPSPDSTENLYDGSDERGISTQVMNTRQATAITLLLLSFTLALQAQAPAKRPHILGISHAGYFVSDLPKALDFWQGLLGYAEPYDIKNPDGTTRIAFIKINDHQHIELFNEPPTNNTGYLSHIAFIVDNAEQMRLYLASHGIAVASNAGKGKTRDLHFELNHPDSNFLQFFNPQPDA